MAMSCSSPEDEDCVVAIKFLGTQLNLCRPSQGNNSEWINIDIKNSSFLSSRVMFSKRYNMFRIPSSGGHFIGSWDLQKHKHKPMLQKVRFRNLPKFTKAKWACLDTCWRSEYLVESPGGCETFMVKWYRKKTRGLGRMKTKTMMVFKLDEQGNAVYTQDIGDLYIFLSHSEPFCISATSCLDSKLMRICVYFRDFDEQGVGYIDELHDDSLLLSHNVWNQVPYYIPPQTPKSALKTMDSASYVSL